MDSVSLMSFITAGVELDNHDPGKQAKQDSWP